MTQIGHEIGIVELPETVPLYIPVAEPETPIETPQPVVPEKVPV